MKVYIAIANEIVNCSSIQVFYKVCSTNYNFEILFISSFVLICSLCYVLSPFKIHSFRSDKIFLVNSVVLVMMHIGNLFVMGITYPSHSNYV